MLDEHLVHTLIGGKDLNRGTAELTGVLRLISGHGWRLLEARVTPVAGTIWKINSISRTSVRIFFVALGRGWGKAPDNRDRTRRESGQWFSELSDVFFITDPIVSSVAQTRRSNS